MAAKNSSPELRFGDFISIGAKVSIRAKRPISDIEIHRSIKMDLIAVVRFPCFSVAKVFLF